MNRVRNKISDDDKSFLFKRLEILLGGKELRVCHDCGIYLITISNFRVRIVDRQVCDGKIVDTCEHIYEPLIKDVIRVISRKERIDGPMKNRVEYFLNYFSFLI